MPSLKDLLDGLWNDYVSISPQAGEVHALLRARGETVVNDHIALRTYSDPRVDVETLGRSFVNLGYEAKENYTFTEKKLTARHFEHGDTALPKVFISQLQLEHFSVAAHGIIGELLDQMPDGTTDRWDFPVVGRPWQVSYQQYDQLRKESEYGAWVAAFGFRANHFTVAVNALKSFDGIEPLNAHLKGNGFSINVSGGEIKGSPEVFLEQSSTLASEVPVHFSDGPHAIASCYYEFAQRYPLPNGKLFQGFVAKSADKIFESTDRR